MGRTPLYVASEQGHDKVVEILIATMGTNLNVATEVSSIIRKRIKQLAKIKQLNCQYYCYSRQCKICFV